MMGCFAQGGVMLGADTRATEGPIVADPNCLKIHKLAANIYACGAGTAADCDAITCTLCRCFAVFCIPPIGILHPTDPVRFIRTELTRINGSIGRLAALMESQLELHRLATGREVRVVTAVTMLARRLFQYVDVKRVLGD